MVTGEQRYGGGTAIGELEHEPIRRPPVCRFHCFAPDRGWLTGRGADPATGAVAVATTRHAARPHYPPHARGPAGRRGPSPILDDKAGRERCARITSGATFGAPPQTGNAAPRVPR